MSSNHVDFRRNFKITGCDDAWLPVLGDALKWDNYSNTKESFIEIRAGNPQSFLTAFEIAIKYNFKFVDKYDQIKTLTKLEQAIWSKND